LEIFFKFSDDNSIGGTRERVPARIQGIHGKVTLVQEMFNVYYFLLLFV
jgi:hypothetical protein